MPSRYQLLIFDLDGTLVDSSGDLAAATNHAMRELGFPPQPVENIREFIGDGARKLVERSLPPGKEALMDKAVEIFLRYYDQHVLDRTRPYDGIQETLDALVGIPKAIATNKPERFTKRIIEGLRWEGYFPQVIGGDTLPQRKPDALVVRTICDRVGISPVGTLVIGDGLQDVGAAKAAGAASCGVSWGFRGPERLREAGADYIIERPQDLVQLL